MNLAGRGLRATVRVLLMPGFTVSFSGVVLAGGRSSRMGMDKALVAVDGQPLWRRQYELLAQAGAGERLISARADQMWVPVEAIRVEDAAADCGPLAGLVAGLERCRGTHAIVVAVDMPRVPEAWLRRLCGLCAAGVGAVGQVPGGGYEPLAAVYPRELLPLAREALGRRELSLQRLIERAVNQHGLREIPIAAEERGWFENWNEPGEVNARR